MPPPLPPPAEAAVGMSAAAPMAAAVATAKIVLRIMGLSWLLLDVLSPHPARQSGEPAVGFNGADKPGAKSRGKEKGCGKVRESDVFCPFERSRRGRAGLPLHHARGRAACRASTPSL